MVNDILNDMDSDKVNSVYDTEESEQVANIIKTSYLEMMSNRNWPHQRKLTKLDSVVDINKPTHLKLPDRTKELVFFKYDKTKEPGSKVEYHEVQYKYPDDFLRIVSSRNPNTLNVQEVEDFSGTTIVVKTNQAPMYWTSFDDNYIVCDGFNSEIEDTLQSSKTQVLLYQGPTFTLSDDFIPDMPSEGFSALIAEAKSTSFFSVKQMANEKAEQKASRQQRWLSRKAWKAHGGIRYDNYGRVSKK